MPYSPLISLHVLPGNLRNVYQKIHRFQRLRHSAMQLLTGESICTGVQEGLLQLLQSCDIPGYRKQQPKRQMNSFARRKAPVIQLFPESLCSHVQPSAECS